MTITTSILNRKTVSISDNTHKELVKLGVYGETIDDIIRKCIESYKREKKQQQPQMRGRPPNIGGRPMGPGPGDPGPGF